MPMALSLFHLDGSLHLIAAHENGAAAVLRVNLEAGEWTTLYKHQAHTQPILSLDVPPCRSYFITSSADAVVAKHPIPRKSSNRAEGSAEKDDPVSKPLKVVNTKHAGQQSLRIRSDGAIFATAGWDAKVRVYSAKSLKEVAVLKWHQSGCCSVAFAILDPPLPPATDDKDATAAESAPHEEVTALAKSRAGVPAYYDVKYRRIQHAKAAHWVAAGSKDGKVSLWDIY